MEFLKAVEFFDLSQDLFCIIGTDGSLQKANNSFLKSVGYSEKELFAIPFSNFFHKDDQLAFIQFYKKSFSHSPTEILVNRFLCSNGSYKWFSWSGTRLSDQPYIYSIIRDVSAQKQLEEELKRSLQFTQRVLNSSLDVICSIDIDGNFTMVSNACENLFGFTSDEMTGKSFNKFLYPADIEKTAQMAKELISGVEMTNFENRYIHKKGYAIPVIWSAKWSTEDQRYYCVVRNATERKRQEEKIFDNEKRFKGLVQTGSDVIAIIGFDGIYKYISPTVTTILGYDPHSLIGQSVFELIHPDYHDLIDSAIQQVSQQYKVELPLYKIKNYKGEWRWIKTVVTNLIDEDSIKGIVANSRDITEQILIEKEKDRAIKRLNNLIENYTQGYFCLDKNWIITKINPATLRLLGMSENQLVNKSIAELFPRDKSTSFYEYYEKAIRENTIVDFEEQMAKSNRWFQITAYPYDDELIVFFKETTDEKHQQLLVNLEKDILEYNLGANSNLKDTVNRYLTGLTEIYKLRFFLSLYNKDKSLLIPYSAPTFPEEYFNAFSSGFPVSQDAGSCGAAAYNKESYIVRDISEHPNFRQYKDILLKSNLLSCWSLPLINAKNKVIGTLAVYHDSIKVPDENEKKLIKRGSAFLQILIESHQAKEHLLLSNERYKYITHASNDAIYDWNILNEFIYWGDGAHKLFGYTEDKSTLADWEVRIHPTERKRINISLEKALKNPDVTYWHEEYRYQRADKSYAFVIEDGYIIRNELNQPIRMVGALKDISKLKEDADQILKQNERLREIATINSHHIRKPLANVLGIINALRSADNDNMGELLSMLEQSSDELDQIVRKIAKKTLI